MSGDCPERVGKPSPLSRAMRREKEQSEHRLNERGRMGGGGVGRGRVAITPAQQVRTQRGAADDSVVAVGAAAAPACPRGLVARRMPAHGRRAASVGWQRPSFGVSAGGGQNGVSPPMPHTRHPVGCESRLVGTGALANSASAKIWPPRTRHLPARVSCGRVRTVLAKAA